jgi:hypothetical protein
MALNRGDARQFADQRLNAVEQPLRRGKAGLDVVSSAWRMRSPGEESLDATRPALGGPCRI